MGTLVRVLEWTDLFLDSGSGVKVLELFLDDVVVVEGVNVAELDPGGAHLVSLVVGAVDVLALVGCPAGSAEDWQCHFVGVWSSFGSCWSRLGSI